MRLLLFFSLLISAWGSAQVRYVAAYECKVHLDFSTISLGRQKIQFNIDSSEKKMVDTLHKSVIDSLKKIINDTNYIKTIFQQMFGEGTTIYLKVEADPLHAILESYSGGNINMHMSGDSTVYKNGQWEIYDSKKDEKQDEPAIEEFQYTGKTKQILDYTCYEAITKDTLSKTVAWVCKDLPQSISPGFTTKNLHCAIFEYANPKMKIEIVLKSLRKYRAD